MSASYLPALDGLRALAVLLVLLYHAAIPGFHGGFIGVDIFFVLSGFLITRLLASDIAAGRLSLRVFYARRVARLQPALYATVLGTIAAGVLILSPPELERLSRSAVAAALSGANILFWLESGYFEPDAASKPLLHTWSLGVEEQFYLLWPWVVALLTRRRHPAVWFAALTTVTLVGTVYAAIATPSAAFYLMPFRVYQFALGGLLAIGVPLAAGTARTAIAGAGVAAVIWTAMTSSATGAVWAGLATTFATAAILAGVESQPVRAAGSWAPFEWIGRRSYSIYLVHWPLMVYFRLSRGTPDLLTAAALVALSIMGGAALHTLVERRFRLSGSVTPARTRQVLVGVAATTLVIVAVPIALPRPASPADSAVTAERPAAAVPQPQPPPVEAAVEQRFDPIEMPTIREWHASAARIAEAHAARSAAVHTGRCSLNDPAEQPYDVDACATPPGGRPAYLVIGDSWAGDTYLVLQHAYPSAWFGLLSIPGCRVRMPDAFPPGQQAACRALYARAFEQFIDASRWTGVVLSASWDPPYEEVSDMVRYIDSRGLRAYVVGQHPTFVRSLPDIVLASNSRDDATRLAQQLVQPYRAVQDAQLRAVLPQSATFIDFLRVYCEDSCPIGNAAGELLYIDNVHVSLAGAREMGERLRQLSPGLF